MLNAELKNNFLVVFVNIEFQLNSFDLFFVFEKNESPSKT